MSKADLAISRDHEHRGNGDVPALHGHTVGSRRLEVSIAQQRERQIEAVGELDRVLPLINADRDDRYPFELIVVLGQLTELGAAEWSPESPVEHDDSRPVGEQFRECDGLTSVTWK